MEDISTLLKLNIKKAVQSIYEIEIDDIPLEHPDNADFGDYSTSISLSLAGRLKRIPLEVAEELVFEIKSHNMSFESENNYHPIISSIEAVSPGFINFKLSESWLKDQMLEILKKGDSYGSNKKGEGKIVLIEFSQPNPNKPMHIGHSRNNFLGSSLSNIFEFNGFNVVRLNYMNDWGTHICKSMLMYKNFGQGKNPNKKPDHFVGDFYRMYEREHKKNPEKLDKELADMFNMLEDGDKETLDLWKKITGWVYDGWKVTYDNENVHFDEWEYQSNFKKSGKEIVERAVEKGIAEKDSSGAIIARFEKFGLPDKVLLRSDGTSIYITQDTQLAVENYEKYRFEKRIYVVDKRQSDYFKQLFKLLELLGFKWFKKLFHLSYGWVSMPGGAMSSREGNVVDADSVFEKMISLEKEEIENSLKDIDNLESTSNKVALGAYRYGMLKVDPKQDIVFDFDNLTRFEGNTGPYLMYTYARAMSLLEKAGIELNKSNYSFEFFENTPLEDREKILLREFYKFTDVVMSSGDNLTPHTIANFLYDLAQKFNAFYAEVPVLNADEHVKDFRIVLVYCYSILIKNGLKLLGIEVVEKM
jgi:arginyl-tRNA synthetase